MSTFAVFGMTADVALAEARKISETTRPSGKVAPPPLGSPLPSGMRPLNSAPQRSWPAKR